ncbi:MAG: outer membrane lipoprotein carrier protein LolA [Deltaproteobacteria bacterium]|nr:outer membrane lipoprotein carrier protein LolA [Deltaproteobacteria bacterium]
MKPTFCILWAFLLLAAWTAPGPAQEPPGDQHPSPLAILEKVRAAHEEKTLCADFFQKSVLSGMGMEDTASGTVCFRHPDKMRWEYEKPERQVVVSDGKTLWIWRPADNQVMKGDAEKLLGPGQGGSFFSDPAVLKEAFDVSMAGEQWVKENGAEGTWALKLVPKNPRPEFSLLYILVDKETNRVARTVSCNPYGDSTTIRFSNFSSPGLSPGYFSFAPPAGADVLRMDQNPSF